MTAGSIWISVSEILAHPYAVLEILGNSLPTVVGYFITLIVTKMLAGLPIIILRPYALCRYLFLRMIQSKKYMTQRELDNVYCLEPVYYGWEYPSQMLVVSFSLLLNSSNESQKFIFALTLPLFVHRSPFVSPTHVYHPSF